MRFSIFQLTPIAARLFIGGLLTNIGIEGAKAAAPVDFVREVRPIFERHCYDCHADTKQKSGLRLDVKVAALKGGDKHSPDIVPGDAEESPLLHFILSTDKEEMMPPKGERLSVVEIATLTRWINEGAVWPDGVDKAKLEDKTDHWSFKAVSASAPVKSQPTTIDHFIDAKLAEKGLHRSPPADPVTWLRRVTFDLTGLPPTPEEVAAFAKDPNYERAVERLLASPRYGERWAQHWLDVVRYADTHGFEVNTERPNAWPYRDYVIRAFNNDTPYDRFIKEQIVGDAMGVEADAATGFLITASVLLPGQIGKDAPSMRLARQDSLDEMVVNLGQTFLGLSIGCARCHDHKFDPITQRDYYAMRAFVAGVEYADRPMRNEKGQTMTKEVAEWRTKIGTLEQRLAAFVPMAHPGFKPRETSPKLNVESFAPVEARFVRFTIHDANLHPKLGLIEPCIDEFEIYSGDENLAPSAKVIASGSRGDHKLANVNDGKYGDPRGWISDTKGRGWLEFELPRMAKIDRIIWGRDRTEKYKDRLATAYTLQAGSDRGRMQMLASVPARRPTVNWKLTTDRFAPVKTKRLRFTTLATNGLEPCIDELEVFDAQGRNVACEAKVTTSGNLIVPNRHDPSYLNDGEYGNERSWLGNQDGKGWVELAFATEQKITRVLWSRDREGKLEDRMTTEYRIEVEQGSAWQLVADSSDRKPFIAGMAIDPTFTLSGLPADEAKEATALMNEKQKLEAQLKSAEEGQLAFAGKFRAPDEIHLLNRGDPEQPKDLVTAAVPAALGKLALPKEAPEQQRRQALADWIASPANPLTARVMVNRIWQGHFGVGLVETASDFGRSGLKPTHLELLDWLAGEFIRSGWSVKHMHRLIVLSETYRQCGFGFSRSDAAKAAFTLDADARYLWRFPSRRLDSEVIHDSMLAISGKLNLTMYGRGFDLFDKRGGLSGFKPVETFKPESQRRMIYAHKVRREREAVFGAFDCPDAGQSTARRRESTTPIQALNLLNSQFTLEHSKEFAARVKREAGEDLAMQITRAYQLALNRTPSQDELSDALPAVRAEDVQVLCRALFNSNEFLFLP